MTSPSHPPAPWRLRGRVILMPALVRAPSLPEAPPSIAVGRGRTVGGLVLADYGPGSTLAYHELLGVGGVVRSGRLPAAWITHAHVDDAASLAGGRAMWGIPKEDADFAWHDGAPGAGVTVSAAGREIVSVTVSARRRGIRTPIAAPFVGRDGNRRAWAAGWLRGTPVSVRVRIPPESPLAELAPVFAHTAVAGDVCLRVGVPRVRPSR